MVLQSGGDHPSREGAFVIIRRMDRKEAHKKLLELRDRAARQPISYKPLFDEAVDIAADLLHELCETDFGMKPRHLR